ncbi:MAG: histidine kinase N-terminal 7TM domain-containing protein, partial [bacterium]|nr:histidine kinase N-terminal 7TM domain-containing protein [bacterium]
MDFSHINFYALSALINTFVSFFFGTFVYSQDKKSNLNRSFALFMFFIATYNLSIFFLIQSTSPELALIFGRGGILFAAFVPLSCLYFTLIFLDIWERYKVFVKWGVAIFSFFALAIVLPTDWLVKSVGPISVLDYFPQMGILYPFFLFFWIAYFVAVFTLLIVYYRGADGIKKAQIRYILLGLTLGNIGGSCNWILAAGIPINPPYIVLSFLVFSYGYAMLRHHLFSIRMFAVEVLTFAIWFVLLVKILTVGETGGLVLYDVGIFFSVVLIGTFLIRIGVRESRQREMLAELNAELDYLNKNLKEKVAEQTKEIRKAYEVEKEAR